VRPATKEQVASLGAKFIAVEDEEFKQAQTAAGYAKPMSAEYQKKQASWCDPHQGPGHRHHHGADPRPSRAEADSQAMIESMKPAR
jgi:NAD(P) transhydrogenase subunit alpha